MSSANKRRIHLMRIVLYDKYISDTLYGYSKQVFFSFSLVVINIRCDITFASFCSGCSTMLLLIYMITYPLGAHPLGEISNTPDDAANLALWAGNLEYFTIINKNIPHLPANAFGNITHRITVSKQIVGGVCDCFNFTKYKYKMPLLGMEPFFMLVLLIIKFEYFTCYVNMEGYFWFWQTAFKTDVGAMWIIISTISSKT